MSSQKRTVEEIDADLASLKSKAATGEREIDNELMGEAFALVMERFGHKIELGFKPVVIRLSDLPSILFGEALGKLGKLGEAGKKVIEKVVVELIARIMFFIMLVMSFSTFGLIPAPPNLEVVFFFYEWLRSIFDEEEEDENEDTRTDDNTGTGNIV